MPGDAGGLDFQPRPTAHRLRKMSVDLYFAYGSNLLPSRLTARTPSARVVAAARLPDYALAWHKIGADGSGKCDIVPSDGGVVHGVVYRIAADEWHHLDTAEERGHGYESCTLEVHTADGPVTACSYRALVTDPDLKPFDWYRDLVAAGAAAHGLPADWRRMLEGVEADPDPDDDRAAPGPAGRPVVRESAAEVVGVDARPP